MNQLPPGWVWARVGELIDLGPKNQSNDEIGAGFVPLQYLGVDYRSRHTFEVRPWGSIKKGYTHFADGDVLLARITPSFENGKAGIVRDLPNGIGAGSTEYFVCRPIPGAILPEYLLAHFKTPLFLSDGQQVMSGAVGQQRVPKQYVVNSQLPLAPLNEQKRIADKLDSILARVDACRERLDRIPAILKRFRQSVLAAATSGKLTEDWRNEMGMHLNDWESVFLNNLVRESANGLSKRRGQSGKETIVLRLADFKKSERVYGNERTIMLEEKEQAKYGLIEKDLLVVRVNGSRDLAGKFIEYKNINNSLETYCDHFIRLRLDLKRIIPKFAVFVSNSGMGRRYIESVLVTSAGQNTINQTALLRLSLNLPLLSEQTEIVRRVEELFAYAGRIEARYQAARARIEKLTPSVLAKAFRGELVPQDPNDEPVSMLLERIRKALPATKQRGRSKANPAAAS